MQYLSLFQQILCSYHELYISHIFYTCYQHIQEMSCFSKEEQARLNTELNLLRRQNRGLQTTLTQNELIKNRLQQDLSKLTNELAVEKKKMIAESIQEMSKVRQQLDQTSNQVSELQRKENRFKEGYQRDISYNLKISKQLQLKIMSTNDLNKIEELQKKTDTNFPISFKSLQDLYLNKDSRYASLNYDQLETNFKNIYLLYSTSLYQEKKIVLCTSFFVDFLQRVIQNGYDQSTDDSRMRTAKHTMETIAQDLYKKFQEVIKIAKAKFTKERSRILDEQQIDNSHEELKLREKIDSLQKVIQNKDFLIKELQGYRTTIQIYEKSTIPSLKEQMNKKEAPQIKEVKSILIEMKSTMLQIGDIVGLQRKMQGEAPSQEAELIELMKGKDLKIQELQQKLFQLEKYKSEWSEETLSQSKRITNESIEKDKEIGILKGRLEESQEEKHKLNIENASYVQRQLSLRRELADKEETLSGFSQQIGTLRKEVAQLVRKNKELNEKKDLETKKMQELASRLIFTSLTLDESKKKIQDLENQLQSFKNQPLQTSEKVNLSETLESSLQQSSEEQEKLTYKIQTLNKRVNELTRLLEEKEALLIEQNLKTSQANLRADSAENRQNELEQKLKIQVKQHNKTKDLLSEANRSLADVSDQKSKIEQQLQQVKKKLQLLELEEKAAKDKLIEQLQDQKNLAKTLQQKLENGGNAGMLGRFRSASFVQHRTLFIGDILEKRKPEKKFLMDSIETHMKQDIEKTNKLYEYKRDNKTNFHQYIDGHSNIVLIIETESALLACYYSGQLQTEATSVMDQQALIVSLDNRKVYKLNNSYNYPNRDPRDTRIIRGMVYDPYYLIFGNAEVRIRSGQNKIFCNFGINNGYFNSQRDRAADLLKVKNKNQVEFINYEIHQIFFNEEYMLQRVQ